MATATIRANASLDGLDKCGEVPKDSMHLLRSAKPGESDLPWYATQNANWYPSYPLDALAEKC